jgi:GNAT superfamily N-acetyltransferase
MSDPESKPQSEAPFSLRTHQPGDVGWVIHRHGLLYTQEFGWDQSFETLVAKIGSQFLENYNPDNERCWIAVRGQERLGSVFLVCQSEKVAKLRLLLVEPSARGMGVGDALVKRCIDYARDTGYAEITLWTNDILASARRIYQRLGFELIDEEAHHSFGHDLVGQNWRLKLGS